MPRVGAGGEGLAGARREHEFQRRVGHAGGDRVGAVDGRDDHDAEPGAGQEGELGGEAVDRAAVAEPEFAGTFLYCEAEAVPGAGAGRGELGLPHGFERLGCQEAGVRAVGVGLAAGRVGRIAGCGLPAAAAPGPAQLAAPEHHPHESREVEHGGVHAARRRHPELEGGCVEEPAIESPHVGPGEVVDYILLWDECAARHADRVDDRTLHVIRERLALRDLERVSHHRDPGVRVLGARLGLVDEGRAVQAGHRGREGGAGVIEVVAGGRLADQPGAVRHELPQGDRRAGAVVGREVGEVGADRRVDVDVALLGQLHDGDVGEELRHRAHPVDRLGGGGDTGRLLAEPGSPGDAVAINQRDRDGREPLLVALALDHGGEGGGNFGVVGSGPDRGGSVVPGIGAGQGQEREQREGEELHAGAAVWLRPVMRPVSSSNPHPLLLHPTITGSAGRPFFGPECAPAGWSSRIGDVNASAGGSTPPCRECNPAASRRCPERCRGR